MRWTTNFDEEKMLALEEQERVVVLAENADEVAAEASALPTRTQHDPSIALPSGALYTPGHMADNSLKLRIPTLRNGLPDET
jgi:hypothetical protein